MHIVRTGVILNTQNYEACVAFYRDVLGLPVLFEKNKPDEGLTCLDMGGVYLMIETGGQARPDGKSIEHCPTKLRFNSTDLASDCVNLERHGVPVSRMEHEWGTTAEFYGPDGNRCALRSDADFGAE